MPCAGATPERTGNSTGNAGPTVMNFMRLNSGRQEDGADLLQEAMVVLLQRLQTPAFDLTNARAFVLATVRNKWLERLRRVRNGPLQVVEMEHLDHLLEQVPAAPDERTYPITDEQLEAAVNDQEEPCRSLLIRFYYQRQSLEEIAAALGWAMPTAPRRSGSGACSV
jgi:RNA polymerase sigma factor (sigma-70 family)